MPRPTPYDDETLSRWLCLLRELGESTRAISGALGISQRCVHRRICRLEADGRLVQPEFIVGRSGQRFPARRT